MQHTPEQAAVIAAPKGNLLVSAAAGSGKTAVLTDRIVQRIIDGQLDIRQVLVMTFTEAAARNMKEKIDQKLHEALENLADPAERRRLGRQLSLLPGASISTIHAFCLDVIRNFYYCAQDDQGQPLIEPGFGIDDGVGSDLLLRQTLDEWMNSQYEAIDLAESLPPDDPAALEAAAWQAVFYRLVEGYGDSSGDQAVRELMLRLHRFLRSLPDYPAFVAGNLAALQAAAADFSASPHLGELLNMLRLRLDRALSQFAGLEAHLAGGIRFISQPERNQAFIRQFRETLQVLRQLAGYLEAGGHDWDEIRALTSGLAAIALPRAGRGDTPEKQQFMDLFCQHVAEVVFFLSGSCGTSKCSQHFIFDTRYVFCLPAAAIEADIAAMLPPVSLLFELVLGLDRQYAIKKRAAGIIDFSDFEHLALAILRREEARQYYRNRFQEVYVDEYQDTSSIQEAIIQAVSDGNCLMVGDVKQSIYRFRHARPRIFMDRAADYQSGGSGGLHTLNRNFRSVAGILAAANDLFSQLMSRGAGEIEYDDSQALAPFRPDDPDLPVPVRLLLVNRLPAGSAGDVDMNGIGDGSIDSGSIGNEIGIENGFNNGIENGIDIGGGEADTIDGLLPDADGETSLRPNELSGYQQEALAVVRQMLLLHGQGYAWKTMVVLSRTRLIGLACRSQLEAYGIPVQADQDGSFLDTPVMRQMEALIHLLDNSRQDIPLAAVLRSDLYQGGFTAGELALIRQHARQQHPESRFYHQAVQAYAADGSDPILRQRVADFIAWLHQLREREQILSLGELISLVFAETGWLDRLAAHPHGEGQIRQLRQFQQWAEQFENRRQRGLHAFARYIENLRSRGPVDQPFANAAIEQDAVRIMTIHGSKGLEFPIVFLVGTGYNLVPKDSRDSILLSESLGIGMDFADPEAQIRFPTHLKLAMLEEIKAAGLAEELRLLYVAITRAMDQLYIAGTVRLRPGTGDGRLAALLQQARRQGSRQLPGYLVLSGRSYLEWLILALARQNDLDLAWLESGLAPAGLEPAAAPAGLEPVASQRPIWQLELFQLENLQRELADWPLPVGPASPAPGGAEPDEPAERAALLEAVLAEPAEYPAREKRCDQPKESPDIQPIEIIRQRVAAPYRYEQAARTPIKLTVSELKRQEQATASQHDPEGSLPLTQLTAGQGIWPVPADLRGINLTLHQWTGAGPADELPGAGPATASSTLEAARLGTLLHAVFRYFDLAAACRQPDLAEIERQLSAMRQAGMFTSQEIAAIMPHAPDILAFVQSGLAADMVLAAAGPGRPIYQEMPFTLAVPACQVYPECAGLAPADRVLVQGIIDCWFESDAGVTLVDYKSDRLPADRAACQAELERRYSLQLAYYCSAIRAATGKTVTRQLIWLIRQGMAIELPLESGKEDQ